MGPVRTEVMWQSVLDAVETARVGGADDGTGFDVLDLGGGTGGDAVRLARLGHRVTVVDPSPDALASLDRRAAEADLGPEARVTGILGDTTDLGDHVRPASFDLVICHGVLEHVEDPGEALGATAAALRPGGHASVVVAGRLAAMLARAMAGDFDAARSLFESDAASWNLRDSGPRSFVLAEVTALLDEHGFVPVQTNALRVFADLVPSALVDAEPGGRDRLFALERLVRAAPDLTSLSGGFQCIARLDLSSAPTDRGGPRATV